MNKNYNDTIIFDNITISDLFRQSHTRCTTTKTVIQDVINKLSDKIKTPIDAQFIAPFIAQCIQAQIENDEQILKLIEAVRKLMVDYLKLNGIGDNNSDQIQFSQQQKKDLALMYIKNVTQNSDKSLQLRDVIEQQLNKKDNE